MQAIHDCMSRARAKYHNIPPKVPPYVHCHSLMADVIFRCFSIVHLSTYVVVSNVYHCGFAPVIHQRPDWAGAGGGDIKDYYFYVTSKHRISPVMKAITL